jgi:hypothetical protein
MKEWPEFDAEGDLPLGVYTGTIAEVVDHFGTGTLRRQHVARRLVRIYELVNQTRQVARFVIFGSFVTGKPILKTLTYSY